MSIQDSKGTPEPVKRLLDGLTKLPGIGKRSAERIAFFLIKDEKDISIFRLGVACRHYNGTANYTSTRPGCVF